MKLFKSTRIIILASIMLLLVLIIAISLSALAASNTVASSRIGQVVRPILISDIRPPACAGLNLTNIIYCTGTARCNGTNKGDLILGDSGRNDISGKNGGDCIIAGGGNDSVNGANGQDVCIEGPGTDTYASCTVVNP
jgi:Ca2+-binding RTX toxin-like protein